MKIIDSFLYRHLNKAINSLTPDLAKQIWEQPIEKASGDEWYLDGTASQKHSVHGIWKWGASIAACFVVCLLSFYMASIRVDTTVYLDVNPSITLQVNCNDKVISATANNSDGEIVLDDMNLKNSKLDVAVNALLGSMWKHGYLNETKDTVLLSVDGRNEEKALALQTQLSNEIQTCLTSLVGSGTVFNQRIDADDQMENLAEKYGISIGKAALLQYLVAENPNLDYSQLAGFSMEDLVNYLAQEGIDIRDFADYVGDFFDDLHDDLDPDDEFDHDDFEPDDRDSDDDFESDDGDSDDDFEPDDRDSDDDFKPDDRDSDDDFESDDRDSDDHFKSDDRDSDDDFESDDRDLDEDDD